MAFEWDPAKSETTERSAVASDLNGRPRYSPVVLSMWADRRKDYGEQRIRAVGESSGELLHVVFTRRGAVCPDYFGPQSEQKGASPMALTRMTLDEIVTRAAERTPEEEAVFRRRMDATTEEDIRRHMIEDGEDPDEEPNFESLQPPQDVRKKLSMTQTEFATLVRIPVATLRNWEQNRFVMEPAAQIFAEADRPRTGGGASCAARAGRRLSQATSQPL